VFGDDPPVNQTIRDFHVDEMCDVELNTRLQSLTREKEAKERIFNRAAPKGSKMAHVRVQKDQLEDEINCLAGQISKLKLELVKRRAY
jgi:phage gp46-like protein